MKSSILRTSFVAAVLLSSASGAAAQGPYATDIYADRYTDLGDGTYRWEMGVLFADSTKGFVASTSSVSRYDTYGPAHDEVVAVSGALVMQLSLWLQENDIAPSYISHNFSRSAATYTIEGVSYVIVASGGGGNPIPPVTQIIVSGAGPRFLNLSFRAVVPANGNIIPGFVIADNGKGDPMTVLLRVSGPTLGGFGVGETLPDPKFTVYDSSNRVVAANDNWGDDAANKAAVTASGKKVGAFPLGDGSKDAATVLTLKPGSYTSLISGAKDTFGEVIVEVYAVEN